MGPTNLPATPSTPQGGIALTTNINNQIAPPQIAQMAQKTPQIVHPPHLYTNAAATVIHQQTPPQNGVFSRDFVFQHERDLRDFYHYKLRLLFLFYFYY